MGYLQDLCYLFLVIPLEEVEGQDCSVSIGQQSNRLLYIFHLHLYLLFICRVFLREVTDIGLFYIDHVHFSFAEAIDRFIDHDPF